MQTHMYDNLDMSLLTSAAALFSPVILSPGRGLLVIDRLLPPASGLFSASTLFCDCSENKSANPNCLAMTLTIQVCSNRVVHVCMSG